MAILAQLYKYVKKNIDSYFNWVNFMVCKIPFNTAVKTTMPSPTVLPLDVLYYFSFKCHFNNRLPLTASLRLWPIEGLSCHLVNECEDFDKYNNL